MTITALSDQAVRLLGSSQLVTTPRAVVKELVDNALDASATSITIEIAANTLDTIQVRDDGHGVPAQDRSHLCKQHCTSKIRDLSDLKTIAPRSLGFRGEALTGISEVAGALHFATRVQGEKVACVIKFQNGRISRESSSLPFGTTVKVLDLFKRVPVRRQVVAKAASRCLVKVKELIQAYALTHPTIRFCLRISKSRSPRPDWIYTPGPAEDIGLAVIKVIGKDCAHQCHRQSLEHAGYFLDAFMLRPGADAEKINTYGPFISIDFRPMLATKGPLQQIYKLYKDKIKMVSQSEPRDPFMYLNLSCPPNVYDINMEPSKDDVIFESSVVLLEAASRLLGSTYGTETHAAEAGDNIEVIEDASSDSLNESPLAKRAVARDSPQWGPVPMNANASNPWIYAKMHSPPKSKRPFDMQQNATRGFSNISDSRSGTLQEARPGDLPTPDLSSSPCRASYHNTESGALSTEYSDVSVQDIERPDDSMESLGLTTATTQVNLGRTYVHLRANQPPVRHRSDAAVPQAMQNDRPRKQQALTAPFKVPRKVSAPNGFSGLSAASRMPKRRAPGGFNNERRVKTQRLDSEPVASTHIMVSDPHEEKASDDDHEGYIQDWLQQHQVARDVPKTHNEHRHRHEAFDQMTCGAPVPTELARDADIADLFLRNSSSHPLGPAPSEVHKGHSINGAARDVGQHVDRLVTALSTSAQAIHECCSVLRSVALVDAAYPDIPAEDNVGEDDFGNGDPSCATTPETLRPTSLSSVSGEEIDEWRAQLLDFLAQEGEGAGERPVQTSVC